ncbi:MAG: Gfo/Idh/MocA family oxidoreductase [Alphaproteobacteria bacterium]|nr:Gfo/Idh/MocA family oxidoreductase [Alphaproteobacteria bacterium]
MKQDANDVTGIKIGIIGLGSAAKNIHIPAYRKIAGCEVVGGIDPVASASEFDFELFPSIESMLHQSRPDIVSIVTPPDSHFEIICELLRFGVHVFCEKPFVTSVEEGKTVIELAHERQRHVVVNNEFRYMCVHKKAKEQIGAPLFGELLFLNINQTFHVTEQTELGWRGKMKRRTCYEFGTHALDLARYFFDADPIAITARMPKPGNPDGPDYLNLISLEFPDDRVAQITLDRLSKGPHRYLDIRLDGSLGCIESEIGGRAEFAIGIKGGTHRPFVRFDFVPSALATLFSQEGKRKLATDPIDLFPSATASLLNEMLGAIASGRRPPCDAADNLKTLELMLAAYRSAEDGGARIKLDFH